MKKVLVLTGLVITILSCSLPVIRSGKADIELSLSGVVPGISTEDIAYTQGARAITPNSLKVRVSIRGKNYANTILVPVLISSALITSLPAYEELEIIIEALDFEGAVTTSWTGTATLNPGRNSLKATMKPRGTIQNFPAVGGPNPPEIPFGKALFYKKTFTDISGEQFIYINTGTHERLWMGVYNENWEPLDTIAESREDGWAVINVDIAKTVYIAIANMRTAGYPPSTKQDFSLANKPARFVSVSGGAGNSGTSANPWNIEGFANNYSDTSNGAFLFTSGTYDTGVYAISLGVSQWLFGGFDPSDWKKRMPRATTFCTNVAAPAITVSESTLKVLDGITIKTNWLGNGQNAASYALRAINSAAALITNCLIEGPTGTTTALTNAGAIYIPASEIIITLYQSEIHGGTLTTSTTTSLSGICFTGSDAEIGIIGCHIDGGVIASSNQNVTTSAIYAYAGNIYAAASYIWGGTARNNSSSNATTYGFITQNGTITVASSVVSGGYAISNSGTAVSAALSEMENDGAQFNVVGCVLDTGIIETSDSSSFCTALYANQSVNWMKLHGTIIISSTPNSTDCIRAPILYSNNGLPEVDNIIFVDFTSDAYNYQSPQYTIITDAQNLIRIQGSLVNFFQSYAIPNSFSSFITNTWRPAGTIAGIQSTVLPQYWGLNMDILGTFPSLLVDLGNRLRPRNSYWTIGPYQN